MPAFGAFSPTWRSCAMCPPSALFPGMARSSAIGAVPSRTSAATSRTSLAKCAASSRGVHRLPKRPGRPGEANSRGGNCSTNTVRATSSPRSGNSSGNDICCSRPRHQRGLSLAGVSDRLTDASLWQWRSTMSILSRVNLSRVIIPALMAAVYFATPPATRAQAEQPSEETWNSIRGDIFKNRPILDGSGLVVLDAPRRAEDSAFVPVCMRVSLAIDDKLTMQYLTLVYAEYLCNAAASVTIYP